jgi:hypothetical protein
MFFHVKGPAERALEHLGIEEDDGDSMGTRTAVMEFPFTQGDVTVPYLVTVYHTRFVEEGHDQEEFSIVEVNYILSDTPSTEHATVRTISTAIEAH